MNIQMVGQGMTGGLLFADHFPNPSVAIPLRDPCFSAPDVRAIEFTDDPVVRMPDHREQDIAFVWIFLEIPQRNMPDGRCLFKTSSFELIEIVGIVASPEDILFLPDVFNACSARFRDVDVF